MPVERLAADSDERRKLELGRSDYRHYHGSGIETVRDNIYLLGFLLAAGLLFYLGRSELPASTLVTWGLTFGATTTAAVLLVSLYRVQVELKASRHELARKDAEINFARQVQKALFPRQLPANENLRFAAVCIPAQGISGDYYDILKTSDGRIIFGLADVSGKGISAAILMANVQALLRNLADSGLTLQEVAVRLNRHLCQVTDSNRFATVFLGDWKSGEMLLNYVNAGHQIPLLRGSRRGEALGAGGLPVGLFENVDYEMGEVRLQPGDLILLYSDGICEALSPSGEMFGEDRLEKLLDRLEGEPLESITKEIIAAVLKWTSGAAQDDMTLVVARVEVEEKEPRNLD